MNAELIAAGGASRVKELMPGPRQNRYDNIELVLLVVRGIDLEKIALNYIFGLVQRSRLEHGIFQRILDRV